MQGEYHISMVSINIVKLQACAALSLYGSVRARRAALKPKEPFRIGCVAPATLPTELMRRALTRVAILTKETIDGFTRFYAHRFSKCWLPHANINSATLFQPRNASLTKLAICN